MLQLSKKLVYLKASAGACGPWKEEDAGHSIRASPAWERFITAFMKSGVFSWLCVLQDRGKKSCNSCRYEKERGSVPMGLMMESQEKKEFLGVKQKRNCSRCQEAECEGR